MGFIKSSGSVLSTNTVWIEIRSPKMEVDGLDELRFIAKAATSDFDALDTAIHTLRCPIARLQHDGIENAPQMLLDDTCYLFDREARRLRMAQAYHWPHPFSAQVRLT